VISIVNLAVMALAIVIIIIAAATGGFSFSTGSSSDEFNALLIIGSHLSPLWI
jgi:hypothetical protein